jgi:ABC-2 type transport system permease protein
MRTVYQLLAFLRRDWRLARTSSFGLAWQTATIICATPTIYYLGRLVRPGPPLAPYGSGYFGFAIVGIAFSGLLACTMGTCAAALRQEQVGGTLDVLLRMPAPMPVLAIGAALWPMLLGLAQALLYVSLGAVLFHLSFAGANLLGAATMIGLAVMVWAALGLVSVAFVLLFRRAEPLTAAMAGVGVMLGGVFYPVDILPPRAQIVARLLPLTHALTGLRLAMLRGVGVAGLVSPILALSVWCAAAVPLGLLVLRWALHEAKSAGTVSGQE